MDTLKCTDPEMKESTLRYAAVALCDLTQMSGKTLFSFPQRKGLRVVTCWSEADLSKSHLVRLGVLEPIKHILTSSTIQNNELKYWTLMLLYQILRSGKVSSVRRSSIHSAKLKRENRPVPKRNCDGWIRGHIGYHGTRHVWKYQHAQVLHSKPGEDRFQCGPGRMQQRPG